MLLFDASVNNMLHFLCFPTILLLLHKLNVVGVSFDDAANDDDVVVDVIIFLLVF